MRSPMRRLRSRCTALWILEQGRKERMSVRCRSAGNKLKYNSLAEAEAAIMNNAGFKGHKVLAAFHCEFCGKYHFGHTKESGYYENPVSTLVSKVNEKH